MLKKTIWTNMRVDEMEATIMDIIRERNLAVCAKCSYVLTDAYAKCPRGCYSFLEEKEKQEL